MTQATPTNGGAPIGNQNAVKAKRCRDALIKALAHSAEGDADAALVRISQKVVALADQGEQWAVSMIFDRVEGKVPAGVELTGANGGEIVVRDAATAMGVARRVAFVLAQGALAKAKDSSKAETEKA